MSYRTVQVFHGQTIPAACPGAENAWTRLYLDSGDGLINANIAAPEVSNPAVLSVSNVAISTSPIEDRNTGEVIAAGQAVTFDVVISKPVDYSLPAEEHVVIPYTTNNGDVRRVKQTFSLVNAIEAGGGILASVFLAGGIAMGYQSIAWGWDGIAFGFGG